MRSRVVLIIFLPILIFLWGIGWSLFWIGSQRSEEIGGRPEEDGVTLTALAYEELPRPLEARE